MEHVLEKILFKLSHSTFTQFTALTELYGLTEAEMINRILHSFAVTSVTITGENKSLYFQVLSKLFSNVDRAICRQFPFPLSF